MHLCEKKHNQQKLVIKRIYTDFNTTAWEGAKNEVGILKSLNHPNIIQYYDSFMKHGVVHIVMEYASKGTLFDFICENKPTNFSPQVKQQINTTTIIFFVHLESYEPILSNCTGFTSRAF